MTERTTVYDIGGLFRVEHKIVPHKDKPYEFVKRIGAVTMLPTTLNEQGEVFALTTQTTRYHYGVAPISLPAGNIDGAMDAPEPPHQTALRELREETGHGYLSQPDNALSVFRLRDVSNTIDYPRYFAVLRNVTEVGGTDDNPHEQVILTPMPLKEYVEPLFTLQRGETYPEINAAFAKAGMELGREAVMQWLTSPNDSLSSQINESFDPWLIAMDPANQR